MPKLHRIPRHERQTPLAKAALAWRSDAFSYIASRLKPPATRQHVAGVAYDERQSARIVKALRMAVARRRYP